MLPAVVTALLASHGYILLRYTVRHILERILWRGSAEAMNLEKQELEIRAARVREASLEGGGAFAPADSTPTAAVRASDEFWVDQGLEETSNATKLE